MIVSLKDTFEFIPKFNGNDKEPPESQIVVTMKFQSGVDAIECNIGGKVDKHKEWMSVCEKIVNLKDQDGNDIDKSEVSRNGNLTTLYIECITEYLKATKVDKKK